MYIQINIKFIKVKKRCFSFCCSVQLKDSRADGAAHNQMCRKPHLITYSVDLSVLIIAPDLFHLKYFTITKRLKLKFECKMFGILRGISLLTDTEGYFCHSQKN